MGHFGIETAFSSGMEKAPTKVLMASQSSTECSACRKPIEAGDPIVYFVETKHSVHEDCNRTEPRPDVAEILRMDSREQKGRQIALTARIRRKDGRYVVPSQSNKSETYLVDLAAESGATCSCPDYEEHKEKCKHVHAVEFALLEADAESEMPVVSITRVKRKTYQQNWPKYNRAQCLERDHFARLLHGLCEGITQPRQFLGRPRHHLADVVFSLVWRAYSGKSLRRMFGELTDFQKRGFIETAPHYNTLSEYDGRDILTPIFRALIEESASPLAAVEEHFAFDSSGFATSRFGRWFDEKWGRERSAREWIKCHIAIGTKTHVVTAVNVTRGYGDDSADARQFESLLHQTTINFDVKEVSADKAYLSKANLDAVIAAGGVPYIPFKANSTGGKGSSLWKKLFHFYQFRHDEFLEHYHRRSNVETVFSMIKGKFGDSVRAKNEVAQENEVLCKVLAHNLCVLVRSIHELNIAPKFWKEEVRA